MKNNKKPKSVDAERFIIAVSELIACGYARSFKEIAEKSGHVSQDFTDLKAGKKDLKRLFLDKVAENYPLNKLFVHTGKGAMINTDSTLNITDSEVNITENAVQSNIGGTGNKIDLSDGTLQKEIQELNQKLQIVIKENEALKSENKTLKDVIELLGRK